MNDRDTPSTECRPYAEAPRDATNDAWRRTMGLSLRSEAAKFIATSFGLDVFSAEASRGEVPRSPEAAQTCFANRFARFLGSEPDAHFAMEHRRFISHRVPKTLTDVSLCTYAPDGQLTEIVPVFDARQPLSAKAPEVAETIRVLIGAFNRSRTMSELERSQTMTREISRTGAAAAKDVGTRILASTAVSFQRERATQGDRFTVPDFRLHRGFGASCTAARCRLSPDGRGVDLWLQCHHAGLDGAPVQEMLDRLEASWGVTAPVQLPTSVGRVSVPPTVCSFEGERRVGLLTDFVDFAPLAQLRRELTSSLAGQVDAVPLASLLIWCLSHQPEFANLGINTAVDVPATGTHARAVDLVSVWPAQYHGTPEGFVTFLRDLLRLFAEARVRNTKTWKALVQLNSLPTFLSAAMLRYTGTSQEKFGTMTVSLVKGTNLVIAPMPDFGWDDGFIAVGNLGVASESGPPVTPISIKGDPDRIRSYPSSIRRAVVDCRMYIT